MVGDGNFAVIYLVAEPAFLKFTLKQEYIRLGCVLTAAVAISLEGGGGGKDTPW